MVRILTECSNTLEEMFSVLGRIEYSDEYPIVLARNRATKSGLQLLSYAINAHPTLRASLRATTENASISLAPLEAILLTPLTPNGHQSYIQMLTVFLDEQGKINYIAKNSELKNCLFFAGVWRTKFF